jgi:hypothetical protein
MSVCAPSPAAAPLTAEEATAELRRAVAFVAARVDAGEGVPSCTGLGSEADAALMAYMYSRDPAALAAAYRAAER